MLRLGPDLGPTAAGEGSLKALKASLDAVGYPYSDESANPAYQLFLR